jgi:hypothetical protein
VGRGGEGKGREGMGAKERGGEEGRRREEMGRGNLDRPCTTFFHFKPCIHKDALKWIASVVHHYFVFNVLPHGV